MSDVANINIRITEEDAENRSPSKPDKKTDPKKKAKEKNKTVEFIQNNEIIQLGLDAVNLARSQTQFLTGSTHSQQVFDTGAKFAKYGWTAIINPYLAGGMVLSDFISSTINYAQKNWEEQLRIGRVLGRSGSEFNRSRR